MHTASSKPKLLPILKGVLVESVAWDKEQVRAHVRRCAAAVLWHSAPGGMQRRRHEPCGGPAGVAARRVGSSIVHIASSAASARWHAAAACHAARAVVARAVASQASEATTRDILIGTGERMHHAHARARALGAATEAAPRPFLPAVRERGGSVRSSQARGRYTSA